MGVQQSAVFVLPDSKTCASVGIEARTRTAKKAAMTDGNTAPSACAVGPSYVSRMLCSACRGGGSEFYQPDHLFTLTPAVRRNADQHVSP